MLRRILTALKKAIRLVVRPRHPVLIPGFSGLPVVYIDSGVQYTISKSCITSMAPAFVSSMFLHTSRSKYENRLVLIIMVHNGAVSYWASL